MEVKERVGGGWQWPLVRPGQSSETRQEDGTVTSEDLEKWTVRAVEERTAERIAQWLEARERAVLRAGHAAGILTVIVAAVRAGAWRDPS